MSWGADGRPFFTWAKSRRIELQFEVNGTQYFLTFAAEEDGWILVTPTRRGIRRVAVENDDAPFINPVMMDTSDDTKKIVN
jgi:hypothetical protein